MALVCLAALLGAPASAQLPVEIAKDQPSLLVSTDTALAANKKLVFDFWRIVRQAHHTDRAAEYLAEQFVERDPTVAINAASAPQPIKATIDDLVSIVAERDLVVLAFRRELLDLENEGQTYTTTGFELFRVANGKIVEHWGYGTKD
jgi:predicted SnoaL-like aldol condensation-catalyzing enzyme